MGSQSSFDNGRGFVSGSEMVIFFLIYSKKFNSRIPVKKVWTLKIFFFQIFSLRSAMDLYSDDEDEVILEARTSMASRYANSLNCTASL